MHPNYTNLSYDIKLDIGTFTLIIKPEFLIRMVGFIDLKPL